MRQALNENPMVQLAVLGVVGVVFAIIVFTTVLKGEETPAAPEPGSQPAAAPPLTTTGDGSTSATAPVAPDPAAPAAAAPETASPGGSAAGVRVNELESGKGLPGNVLAALDDNKAVAILVYDPSGKSDRKLRSYAERAGNGNVKMLTVKAKNVSDYSRITQGVNVSRTPALIVIRPPKLTGGELTAIISEGFRGEKSVGIALEDALYSGRNRPSFPD